MNKNNFSKLCLISLLTFSLASCSEEKNEEAYMDDKTFNETTYYDKVETRSKFANDDERNIDEHLENGVLNDSYWNSLSGVWQNESATYPHNGVQKRNLLYVKDGKNTYLGFRGRGMYNTLSDTNKNDAGHILPEGACIISKNRLGPGRYEFEMAAMPHYGGVSAAWTYMTETGNELTSQNEIDIENFRKKLNKMNHFNLRKIFIDISQGNLYITTFDLQDYFELNKDQSNMLLKRFDKDDDGKISYDDVSILYITNIVCEGSFPLYLISISKHNFLTKNKINIIFTILIFIYNYYRS